VTLSNVLVVALVHFAFVRFYRAAGNASAD